MTAHADLNIDVPNYLSRIIFLALLKSPATILYTYIPLANREASNFTTSPPAAITPYVFWRLMINQMNEASSTCMSVTP